MLLMYRSLSQVLTFYFFLVYQERGIHFQSNFDIDEETKYSSVMRGVDDSGYEENEDIWRIKKIMKHFEMSLIIPLTSHLLTARTGSC